MKKYLSVLLAFAMILSLAACSGTQDVHGIKAELTPPPAVTAAPAETKAPAETAASEATEAPETPEEPEATEEPEADLTLGSFEGLTYENAFIGIGCKLGSGWRFYSEEEITQLNGLTQEYFSDDYLEKVKNADMFYDMYAAGENGVDSINVILQKLNPIQLIALDTAQSLEASVPDIEKALGNMGYTDIKHEMGKATLGSGTYDVLYVSSVINGVNAYQASVLIKCNGYVANITFSTFIENGIEDLMKTFYSL